MKTSIILIALIFINTSAILAEPIASLLKGVNVWLLLSLEDLLIIGYYINSVVQNIRKVSEIDLSNLKLFVVKKKSA
ncbi:MAG: hypothetical protein HKN90_08935 [Flavobacteriaceae bacterium]|nr:hypothetical protein [Flavobacteriaceae bacterium]